MRLVEFLNNHGLWVLVDSPKVGDLVRTSRSWFPIIGHRWRNNIQASVRKAWPRIRALALPGTLYSLWYLPAVLRTTFESRVHKWSIAWDARMAQTKKDWGLITADAWSEQEDRIRQRWSGNPVLRREITLDEFIEPARKAFVYAQSKGPQLVGPRYSYCALSEVTLQRIFPPCPHVRLDAAAFQWWSGSYDRSFLLIESTLRSFSERLLQFQSCSDDKVPYYSRMSWLHSKIPASVWLAWMVFFARLDVAEILLDLSKMTDRVSSERSRSSLCSLAGRCGDLVSTMEKAAQRVQPGVESACPTA